MKLSKIKLHNYRCFGDGEQVILIEDLVAFIGNNSAGKTAALCALNCIFSENTNERILKRSDFHLPKDIKPEELLQQEMYIEVVFTFEELESEDGEEYAVPQFFESLVVDSQGGTPYLRIRLIATWENSTTLEGAIDSKVVYITCSEKQEFTEEDIIDAQRRDLDRIRVVYIPAVREPAKQLKNVSGTMMHQIMSSINWSDVTKQNVTTKIQELNAQFMGEKGVSILGESIKTQWKEYDTDVRYSNAELRFNSTDLDSSIKKSEIVFLPTVTGKEYNVDEMGDGLRSLFYISMVDSMLDVENTIREEIQANPDNLSFSRIPPILTIIAVEEPENHISPHLIGKLIKNLKNIAAKSNAQTILTSPNMAVVENANKPICLNANKNVSIQDRIYDEEGIAATVTASEFRSKIAERKMFNPYNDKEIKDVAPTQTANCGCSTSSAAVLISEDGKNYLKIRKLTPLECWRLMGFDDEDFYKAKDVGVSDTQLYRQAGNSIVVNVLEKIIEGLLK